MQDNDLTSKVIPIVKTLVVIGVLVFAGYMAITYLIPRTTDMTPYVNTNKATIETELSVSLPNNPDMLNRVYEYTKGEVTACGSNGLAVVYIDGLQAGLHVTSSKYSLYGVKIGDSTYTATDSMTYQYDDSYVVLDDLEGDTATATFYVNKTNNDCLIIVHNNLVNKIIAITYYNDMKKATEELSSI